MLRILRNFIILIFVTVILSGCGCIGGYGGCTVWPPIAVVYEITSLNDEKTFDKSYEDLLEQLFVGLGYERTRKWK